MYNYIHTFFVLHNEEFHECRYFAVKWISLSEEDLQRQSWRAWGVMNSTLHDLKCYLSHIGKMPHLAMERLPSKEPQLILSLVRILTFLTRPLPQQVMSHNNISLRIITFITLVPAGDDVRVQIESQPLGMVTQDTQCLSLPPLYVDHV